MKATVRYENNRSEEITMKTDIRQGCILSPCQFKVYKEYFTREALEDGKRIININGQNITNIKYAHDTIILAESEQQLHHMIDKLDATCEQYGMEMNGKKTITVIVEKTTWETKCGKCVKEQQLTQVKEYQYVG